MDCFPTHSETAFHCDLAFFLALVLDLVMSCLCIYTTEELILLINNIR